jgi:predicted methyltransferase
MQLRLAPGSAVALCLFLSSCATLPGAGAPDASTAAALNAVLSAGHRSAEHKARDSARHPRESLLFFGARPDMTVVEMWPGAGWYTQILAPLVRAKGQLYVAQMDASESEYAKTTVQRFRDWLAARPDLYDKVIVTTLASPPGKSAIAPAGSADLVVTFRNLHNWMAFGWQREAIEAAYAALKPGGVLGVVDHRAQPGQPADPKAISGYVNEDHAIELIESVGFKLTGRSQINANPKDSKDYEQGVWTLPPSYIRGDQDRERYRTIGESDRFTLKFIKPKTVNPEPDTSTPLP